MGMRSQDLPPDRLQIFNVQGIGMLVRTAGTASYNQHIRAILHGISSRCLGSKSQLATPGICYDSRIETRLIIMHVRDSEG
jgi:hypothetical protein